MLGLDTARPFQALAAHAATGAAGLAQTAGAIACGTVDVEAYHSTRHGVLAWYLLLSDHGWEPDDWTAGRFAVAAERQTADEQPDLAEAGAEMADESDEGDTDTGGDPQMTTTPTTEAVDSALPAEVDSLSDRPPPSATPSAYNEKVELCAQGRPRGEVMGSEFDHIDDEGYLRHLLDKGEAYQRWYRDVQENGELSSTDEFTRLSWADNDAEVIALRSRLDQLYSQ